MKTYRAVRRLLIGTEWREGGDLVPEAATWRLVESLVRAGEIEEVEVNSQELTAAIQQFCPDDAAEIYTALGVEPYTPEPEPEPEPEAAEVAPPKPKPRRSRKEKAPILVEPPEPVEG